MNHILSILLHNMVLQPESVFRKEHVSWIIVLFVNNFLIRVM